MTTSALEPLTSERVDTETMRGAVVRAFGEPPQIEEVPKPAAGAGKTRVIREERPLADAQAAMKDVLQGRSRTDRLPTLKGGAR
jgi:hypothetical protein